MSSEVDICNLALSHLGDEAGVVAIKPPDGTIQAAHCGRFYPIARDLLLEMHPWPFAVKRKEVAEVENPSPDDWAYAYALPAQCLRPLTCLVPGQTAALDNEGGGHAYLVEAAEDGSSVIYTNVPAATIRYIARVTDTTRYSPAFVVALARLLAAHLAGPIVKAGPGVEVAAAQMKLFGVEYAQAAALSANVGKNKAYETRTPGWLAARGGFVPAEGRVTY